MHYTAKKNFRGCY